MPQSAPCSPFQRDYMITAIGQAGPRTLAALLGSERANQLTINHMQSGVDLLGLPLATMATVAQVESIGEGFTTDMRPVVLFERHVFYKQLTQHLGRALPTRWPPITPTWSTQARRLCGQGGRSGAAATRHQPAPGCRHRVGQLGMFQIMGFHWQALGFASASDWQTAMQRSEVGPPHRPVPLHPAKIPPCTRPCRVASGLTSPAATTALPTKTTTTTPNWPRHTTILPRSIR